MRKIAIAAAVFVALAASPAHAQATRTFVSPTGNDASPSCSLTAPCRTFAAAYTLTNAGGEIAVLGTAGYGVLTISKAISIVNGGGFEAAIAVAAGGTGITINAGATDAVSLRGLTIDGGGLGATGIVFNTGAFLTIENCVIRHMTGDGVDFQSTTASSALTVSNSLVADNSVNGILVDPTGSAKAIFNRVEANNNGEHGIIADGEFSAGTNKINVTVFDSVAANNGGVGSGDGFDARTQTGFAPTSVMVFHSVAANNGNGVQANGAGATLRLANSTVTGNTNGWQAISSGVLLSDGDNTIEGNGGNEGAPTTYARK
jgi:hypothetical protein